MDKGDAESQLPCVKGMQGENPHPEVWPHETHDIHLQFSE